MSNRVCKLILVEVNDTASMKRGQAKQSNKYYNMTDNGDTISVEYGRVDSSCTKITKPSRDWDKIIKSKIKKGYKDVTHLILEDGDDTTTTLSDIPDAVIDRLFKQLQQYANKTIRENYKVSSHKVTQAMVDEAQVHIDSLANILKKKSFVINSFNDELLALFHVIPRRMKDVSQWLVDTGLESKAMRERCEKLLSKEQSTLDVMAGQVVVNSKSDAPEDATTDVKRDILTCLGLDVGIASEESVKAIKELMGDSSSRFSKAYTVTNKTTQQEFDINLGQADDKTTKLFWHGSRNENWLNIISTGLLIRPSGAVHTGSMFGDGIYFADKAQKSIGYSSVRGSYWAGGSDNIGYLALFTVHTGKPMVVRRANSSLSKNSLVSGGYHSVFAEGGADLRNNEYIVYDKKQCTISYLVEIKG
jgi:poly [ADP-ribose] polymerase